MNNDAVGAPTDPAQGSDAGSAVGTKFWPNGKARRFPGNTIISLIQPETDEAQLLGQTVAHLRSAFGDNYVLLPPSSWHMTVFELLCDQVRDTDHWTTHLDPDIPLETVDEYLAERCATVQAPARLNMKYKGIDVGPTAVGVLVEPDDSETAEELHRYRDELSEATGIRFPNHATYQFHITLAYTLKQPQPSARAELDASVTVADAFLQGARFHLDRPVFTYFADMTHFAVNGRDATSP